jgi:hypothetical protein
MNAPRRPDSRNAVSEAALAAEHWRRELQGMDPHPALQAVTAADLQAAFARVAWFGPTDDRRDPWLGAQLHTLQRANARRVCYLIGAAAVGPTRDGRSALHSARYGEYHNLCRDERFWDQPSVLERDGEAAGGYGYTGLLVSDRHVLTCWHGWESFSHRAHVAIFGYAMTARSDATPAVDARAVVPIAPYPWRQPAGEGRFAQDCSRDWVVLELAQPVAAARRVAPLRLASPQLGVECYTLGHPCGLPVKLADRARVLAVGDGYFRTDLDTFTGNSGSPVFDARTHALIGLVSEGQKDQGDFEPSPARGCYVSNRIDRHVTGQLSVPVTCFADALQTSGSA